MAAQVAPPAGAEIAPPAQQAMDSLPYNKEGAVLEPPLPPSWTLEKLKSGELPVRLFGDLPSPSNQRVRYLLKFYEIPFTITFGKYSKVDPSYEYKKMPVMRIGDAVEAHKTGNLEKGRFINDGYTMINALAPALQGRPFNDDEVEIQKRITFGFQYPFIVAAVASGKWTGSTFKKLFPNCSCPMQCCGRCCLTCCVPCCICPVCCNECCCKGGKVVSIFKGAADENNVPLTRPRKKQSFIDAGKWLAEKLADKEYFAGEKYGVCDVDLFGHLHHNARKLNLAYANDLIEADPRLKAWFDRMDKIAGHVDHFDKLEFKKANE